MSKISFNQLGKEVKLMRANYGAPESFMLKERVKTSDMSGKKITLDNIVVSNQVKMDKNREGKYVPVKTADGSKDIYQALAYVGFDGDKYFVTKSQLLIRQLERLTGETLVFYEPKETEIQQVKGTTIIVSSEKVKYADGKDYEQIIFDDAE